MVTSGGGITGFWMRSVNKEELSLFILYCFIFLELFFWHWHVLFFFNLKNKEKLKESVHV